MESFEYQKSAARGSRFIGMIRSYPKQTLSPLENKTDHCYKKNKSLPMGCRSHDLASNIILPYEVVVQILTRVRKKRSLARLKCVSREWNRILSHDPWFDEMLRNHKRRTQRAWILRMSPNRLSSSIDRFNVNCEVKDLEKGALIREFALPLYYFNDAYWDHPEADDPIRSGSLLFYQSALGESLFLFDIKTDDWFPQRLPRPSLSPTLLVTYGFGYSYKSRKYKVVRLCCTSRWSPSCDLMSCEVYSAPKSGAAFGSWRQISEECPCRVWGNGVVANDMVHWISRESVVSFDLHEEIFTTMPFSDLMDEQYRMRGSLANLKGRLCLVSRPIFERGMTSLRVWPVKDYGEGTWECWCDINLAGLVYGDERRFKTFRVAYVGDEELVFVARLGKDDYREVYCDMREGGRITRLVNIAYGPIILCGKARI